MPNLQFLPARDKDGHFRVVVEAPAGSNLKLKYDPDLGVFLVGRPLILGLTYPYDWGFVPGTRAADGDPLNAMVLGDAGLVPRRGDDLPRGGRGAGHAER